MNLIISPSPQTYLFASQWFPGINVVSLHSHRSKQKLCKCRTSMRWWVLGPYVGLVAGQDWVLKILACGRTVSEIWKKSNGPQSASATGEFYDLGTTLKTVPLTKMHNFRPKTERAIWKCHSETPNIYKLYAIMITHTWLSMSIIWPVERRGRRSISLRPAWATQQFLVTPA